MNFNTRGKQLGLCVPWSSTLTADSPPCHFKEQMFINLGVTQAGDGRDHTAFLWCPSPGAAKCIDTCAGDGTPGGSTVPGSW